MADVLSFGYAALVAMGGIMGYMKAGSTMSLLAGLLFGGLSGYGAVQTTQDPKNVYLSLVVAALLAGVMGHRYSNSGKFWPPGFVCLLSVLQALRFIARLM